MIKHTETIGQQNAFDNFVGLALKALGLKIAISKFDYSPYESLMLWLPCAQLCVQPCFKGKYWHNGSESCVSRISEYHGLRPAILFKKTLVQVFFCEFAKFLTTPFLQNTSGQLLLYWFLTKLELLGGFIQWWSVWIIKVFFLRDVFKTQLKN